MILKGRLIKVHGVVHGASSGGRHALGRYQTRKISNVNLLKV
jgi:hypothetical protein